MTTLLGILLQASHRAIKSPIGLGDQEHGFVRQKMLKCQGARHRGFPRPWRVNQDELLTGYPSFDGLCLLFIWNPRRQLELAGTSSCYTGQQTEHLGSHMCWVLTLCLESEQSILEPLEPPAICLYQRG